MSKKILFCSFFILIFLIPSKQDPNAKTWERHNTTIHAESILTAIDRGDSIIIHSCKIVNSLIKVEVSESERPDTIKSYIEIKYSVFSDTVAFVHCYFMEDIIFWFDTVGQTTYFFDVEFSKPADFWGTTFSGDINFRQATFHPAASFRGATFEGDAAFRGVAFGGPADFSAARFDTSASFAKATFDTTAYFWFATFGGNSYFDSATFAEKTIFRQAIFDSTTSFANATFHGLADFTSTTFGAETYLQDARFDTTVFFTKTTFDTNTYFWFADLPSYAYFDSAVFGGDTHFEGAIFGKTVFVFANFEKKVYLIPEEFKHIYISWEQLKDHIVYNQSANYRLMKNFEELRQLGDADGIYLFLRNQERMRKSPLIRYPEYWFIQLTCGYGRKPLNTFILSIILVILFAVFFTESGAIKEIEKDFWSRRRPRIFREIPKSRRKRFYYALYFSLHTFIIGVVSDWHATDEFLIKKMIQIKLLKFGPNIKLAPRFKFRTLSMIEGALGWILVIILIISLERTIGR